MLFKKAPDFRVSYSFRLPEEDGRQSGPPKQGFRCDFLYADQIPGRDPVYYIWPEFENDRGEVLPKGEPVLAKGHALMFIVQDNLREFHKERVRPGVRAYFLEGNRVVGDLEIIEVFSPREGA